MKTLTILFCSLLTFSTINAQKNDRPVFKKGYVRLGFSTLGNNLDNNLSPSENIFKGNYGASTGYVFEKGHVYYFKSTKTKSKINYGLDWTVLSATYNKLDKWDAYAAASKTNPVMNDTKFSVSAASKLGPVISINPVERLVIDVRLQVAAIGRVTPFEYYENENEPNARSFAFYNYEQENIEAGYKADAVKNMVAFGVGTNAGITIRHGAFGVSLDYSTVKPKTNYDAYNGNNHTFGKEKIPTHTLQLKLSLTL